MRTIFGLALAAFFVGSTSYVFAEEPVHVYRPTNFYRHGTPAYTWTPRLQLASEKSRWPTPLLKSKSMMYVTPRGPIIPEEEEPRVLGTAGEVASKQ